MVNDYFSTFQRACRANRPYIATSAFKPNQRRFTVFSSGLNTVEVLSRNRNQPVKAHSEKLKLIIKLENSGHLVSLFSKAFPYLDRGIMP